jgi:hypothetical protein
MYRENTHKRIVDSESPRGKTVPLIASIKHHVPRRLRMRIAGAAPVDARLQQMKDLLSRIRCVTEIEFNPLTGSILIHYEHGTSHDIIAEIAKQAGENLVLISSNSQYTYDLDGDRLKNQGSLDALSKIDIASAVRKLDRHIRGATADLVDLKLLVATGIRLLT